MYDLKSDLHGRPRPTDDKNVANADTCICPKKTKLFVEVQ